MNIKRIIASKNELNTLLPELLEKEFHYKIEIAELLFENILSKHIDQLKDDLFVLIETPYIDKVYRDSYYNYFSTKLSRFERDCMRLSFFSTDININDFLYETKWKQLNSDYLGFMVLRPTDPQILGRSVLSPMALKENDFLCVTADFNVTVNSIKFQVTGFPHSSQDEETITCAETTIWALMEYFSTKYPEYMPVLPSKIIDTLRNVSNERQVPSAGLSIQQIAFALKEYGFGTKIYSSQEYGDNIFKRLFSTYIESGIPIIAAVENKPEGNISHAVIAAGREKIKPEHIDNLVTPAIYGKEIQELAEGRKITIYDNDDINKSFIIIDDNSAIYTLASFEKPAIHYSDTRWHNCRITHFVAPLYPKIYLEAFRAKGFFLTTLINYYPSIPEGSELFIRFYLCSSRSFKHELSLKQDFDDRVKNLILETLMPKFIWIGEVSDKKLIKTKEANGLFILDATQANGRSARVLILSAYMDVYISYDPGNNWIKKSFLSLGTFSIFTNNLKGY